MHSLAEESKEVFRHPREDDLGSEIDKRVSVLELMGTNVMSKTARERFEEFFSRIAITCHDDNPFYLSLTKEEIADLEEGKLADRVRQRLIIFFQSG